MLKIEQGDVVMSVKGRDNGYLYFVKDVVDNDVYLMNGKKRTQKNLKKKNIKHIKLMNICVNDIKNKIKNGEKFQDSDIKKQIDNLNVI